MIVFKVKFTTPSPHTEQNRHFDTHIYALRVTSYTTTHTEPRTFELRTTRVHRKLAVLPAMSRTVHRNVILQVIGCNSTEDYFMCAYARTHAEITAPARSLHGFWGGDAQISNDAHTKRCMKL